MERVAPLHTKRTRRIVTVKSCILFHMSNTATYLQKSSGGLWGQRRKHGSSDKRMPGGEVEMASVDNQAGAGSKGTSLRSDLFPQVLNLASGSNKTNR